MKAYTETRINTKIRQIFHPNCPYFHLLTQKIIHIC